MLKEKEKLICILWREEFEMNTSDNNTYPKEAVQCLNEALCFVSNSVLADSLRLRNRQLFVAANRFAQWI